MATVVPHEIKTWIYQHAGLLRRISIVAIIASVLLIAWAAPIVRIVRGLESRSRELGPWQPVVFVAAYTVFTIFSLPVWLMPFLAGGLFGTLWGTLVSSASCVISAAITFLIARYFRRTSLCKYLDASPRMRALEKTIAESDWKVIAALRLSHFLTFGLQNYALGLTEVRFRTFLLATWIVTLPGTLFQAYLGHLGFSSVDVWQDQSAADWQVWSMRLGGLVIIGAAVAYIGYLGRTVYRDALEAKLNERLKAEESDPARAVSWPWGVTVLAVFATLMLTLAVWTAFRRDVLRERGSQAFSMSGPLAIGDACSLSIGKGPRILS